MAEKEKVLDLGVEGGSATIYRMPLATGGWQFHVEGSSIYLDENDHEGWRYWTGEPMQTIQDAVRSVTGDGQWLFFVPHFIHPEYRMVVWEMVQETASMLSGERRRWWKSRTWKWEHQCLEKPSGGSGGHDDDEIIL